MTTDPSSLRLYEYCPSDFLYGPVLGEGRFGTVVYAELKTSETNDGQDVIDASSQHDTDTHLHKQQNQNQAYAIKMIPKSEIIRHNQIQAVLTEKYILSEVLPTTSSENHNQPTSYSECIMKLFLCFHDTNYLYFVLELCAGGTLLDLIQQTQTNNAATDTSYIPSAVLDISWVRYYACQILQAIEYLHQRGVVHRDLSPQNIGLTFPKGEVRLGDFGAAAVFVTKECEGTETKLKRWMPSLSTSSSSSQGRENSSDFVGTAGYVSPEMIRGNSNNNNGDTTTKCTEDISNFPAMDLWSFGCIIYHMIVGKSPFHALGEHSPIQNMLDYTNGKKQLIFPSFIDTAAKDLISSLLKIEPGDRIGIQDSIFGSSKQCLCAERDGTETSLLLKQYQAIRDNSFFDIDEDVSIWSQTIEPPYKPDQPNWMKELNLGDTTLKSLDSIEFDI